MIPRAFGPAITKIPPMDEVLRMRTLTEYRPEHKLNRDSASRCRRTVSLPSPFRRSVGATGKAIHPTSFSSILPSRIALARDARHFTSSSGALGGPRCRLRHPIAASHCWLGNVNRSVQHPAFYRYQESYPRRNGSPRNCCSRSGDERNAVPVSVGTMQTAEAAIPLRGIPYRKRRARKTTPHMRLPEPRRARLAIGGMYTLLLETQE